MNTRQQRCVVRAAIEDDLLGLLQLFSQADEGLRPPVTRASQIEISTWATMLQTQNLTTYVAEFDGQISGTALFLTMPNLGYDCRPSGFIKAMVVSAAHRRQGIARRIMNRIIDDADAAGCHKIQLLTHKRHATDGAHDFYRSMGFKPEAEGFRLYLNGEAERAGQRLFT
jgi:GNAT superfamily N-acetyltransferase